MLKNQGSKLFIGLLIFIQIFFALKINAAAGILPYTFKEGTLLFLLGKEANGWSDFGGFIEKNETILDAAIHEFSQETRYVYGKFYQGLPLDKHYSLDLLEKASRNYIEPKITHSVNHPKGTYVLYLACVDYIPSEEFTTAFKTPDYDKDEYSWVNALDLLHAISMSSRKKTFYKTMKIRKEFAEELKSDAFLSVVHDILDSHHLNLPC